MSDKFQDTFPIPVEFDDGEQPNAEKFSAWADQTNTGFNYIEKAVGDIWGTNQFTGTLGSSHNYLLCNHDGENAVARLPNIANLARLIGPASALSPMRQGRQLLTVTWTPASGTFAIPEDVHAFRLPCPPLDISGTYPDYTIAIDSSSSAGHIRKVLEDLGATEFQNWQTALADVDSTGDYYIDKHGIVHTFTPTSDHSLTAEQSYYAEMYWDAYDHASMNVIPDWTDDISVSGNGCTVADAGGGVYTVLLSTITTLPKYSGSGQQAYEPGDSYTWCPPEDYQAVVPYVLASNLANGDTIPDGFMQLWDIEATDTDWGGYVPGLTFVYEDPYTVRVSGATLEEGSGRYRLVTVGTTITESINELRWQGDVHDHSEVGKGQPIAHSSLTGNHIQPSAVSSDWSITVASPPSGITGNHHPQYLSRYGYNFNMDPGQYDNAMLGDLFMANERTDYTASDYRSNLATSRKVCFSSTDNAIYYNYNSPFSSSLYLKSTNDLFTLYSKAGNYCALNIGRPDDGTPSYGTISWSGTLDRGFALYHDGEVKDAWLQTGSILVLDETSPLSDPSILAVPASRPDTDYIAIIGGDVTHTDPAGSITNPAILLHKQGGGICSALEQTSTTCMLYGESKLLLSTTNANGIVIQTTDNNADISLSADGDITLTPGATYDVIISGTRYFDFSGAGTAIMNTSQGASVEGAFYFDTADQTFRVYDSSEGKWYKIQLVAV